METTPPVYKGQSRKTGRIARSNSTIPSFVSNVVFDLHLYFKATMSITNAYRPKCPSTSICPTLFGPRECSISRIRERTETGRRSLDREHFECQKRMLRPTLVSPLANGEGPSPLQSPAYDVGRGKRCLHGKGSPVR
jgi:hypothetical protein